MNRKMVFYLVGCIILALAGLLMLPALISLLYREIRALLGFGSVCIICTALGLLLVLKCKTDNRTIYAREGFAIVALGWILMSAIGAVPFVISGDIPNYIDALFETASGFTTTGSSILTDVEALSHGALFWRSFTHWVGGMGVLIFIMAIMPSLSDRSIHIMRAEMPGPVIGKLVPRARDTAKILYLIYIVMTGAMFVLLLCGGMPFFDSLVTAIGTAGTGGFGIKADSIAGYNAYCQWVITAFMLLFGINFNLYYLITVKKIKAALSSVELWVFLGIFGVSAAAITLNILDTCTGVGEAVRLAAFQVASVMSTSGFATADFNLWPELSKGILVLLMFIGGCAGSTAGGFKLSRVIMLYHSIKREIRRLLHPRSVSTVRFEGRPVDEQTISSVSTYLAIYIALILFTFLLLCFDPVMGFTENATAAISCVNNIGPGLGKIGPASSFAEYSPFSKLVLTFAMLAGRLEIYPILLAILPSTWLKK